MLEIARDTLAMPRIPDPRAVALENAAFLRHLRATGNAHEAARAVGASRSRFTKRRARDPAFALRWDAALAWAQSALSDRAALSQGPASPRKAAAAKRPADAAEPHLLRLASGAVQVRRRPATAIAPADETRFLLALSATANVRLAARAAGFAPSSFYARRRRHPGFAREMRLALEQGYARIEMALVEAAEPDAYEHDAWTRNDPPAIPPMAAAHALQLLHLHQKEARLLAEPAHLKKRRGEPHAAHLERLAAMHEARHARAREEFALAEAERRARGEGPYWGVDAEPRDPHEPPPVDLPDLSQVTGWSRAKPAGKGAEPMDGDGRSKPALFGGWRIEDWRRAAKRKRDER